MDQKKRTTACHGVLAVVLASAGAASLAADKPQAAAELKDKPAAATATIAAEASPAPARESATAASASVGGGSSDPTLIVVPSNTLGPGVPLWMRREREEAGARIARAAAEEAEARAALAHIEAERAAESRFYFSEFGGGVVVYGPRRPGLERAVRDRPTPPRRPAASPSVTSTPVDDDPFDAAQRQFAETARPRIGPAIERQLEAQRRFGENVYPTKTIEIQRGIDDAVIRARRGAPKPQDASK